MSQHSVADAKAHLSALIDRALAGEGVVVTRHGVPVVVLQPVQPPVMPMTDAELDWLAARRAASRTGKAPLLEAGELLSQMRDDWGR